MKLVKCSMKAHALDLFGICVLKLVDGTSSVLEVIASELVHPVVRLWLHCLLTSGLPIFIMTLLTPIDWCLFDLLEPLEVVHD